MYTVERPTVLVDMDGVLADFDGKMNELMREHMPHITPVERQNFYYAQDYPEHEAQLSELSLQEGFFSSLSVVEGAIEGWNRILEAGYNPRICSSPIRANPYCTQEKLGWVEQELVPRFGKLVLDQAVITRDKHEVPGIALIDDRPALRLAEVAMWQHIVYDQPYNKASTAPRLFGWDDPNLETLLARAAQAA
jgi:5'-nucleotidase